MPLAVSGRFVAENGVRGPGAVKLIADQVTRAVLGVHLLGPYAPETIWGAAAVLENELTIDDLRQAVDANLRSRQEAAAQADALIDMSVTHYAAWRGALNAGNPLPQLRHAAETQRDEVLARATTVTRREVVTESCRLVNNDSVLEARALEDDSIDLMVTSVPFGNQ